MIAHVKFFPYFCRIDRYARDVDNVLQSDCVFHFAARKWNEPGYNESQSNVDDENNVVDDHHIIQ